MAQQACWVDRLLRAMPQPCMKHRSSRALDQRAAAWKFYAAAGRNNTPSAAARYHRRCTCARASSNSSEWDAEALANLQEHAGRNGVARHQASSSSSQAAAVEAAEGGQTPCSALDPELAWSIIRREAEADAKAEPLLSSFLYASILSHDSFERSLAFVLSNRLADTTLLSTELFEVFYNILRSNKHVADAARADICAVRERDPACGSYSQALLFFKGFHAIQAHRIAHELWLAGRKIMACALQSRMSEVFAVDIHPAARIGKGILLDHGTGVVIGETAVVGDNVSILQNVTLGGTGKEHGDRHPKIGDGVLIGASASILGNITVGRGAQVAAGSLVLKPVPEHTWVAGSPAHAIGTLATPFPATLMEQWHNKCSSREGDGTSGSSKGSENGSASGDISSIAEGESEYFI